jgi:SAM-dependent methyltransferase
MSVVFDWYEPEMQALLETCPGDPAWGFIQRHFTPGARLLEAGCGSARWVRFLADRGYKIVGLELNAETVEMVRKVWPDLEVVQGNCEASPFPENSFDGALSFGVVEHWVEGPTKPLADLYRVLKPGGKALVTVPCFNTVRRWKRRFWINEVFLAPRALAGRLFKGKPKPLSRRDSRYRYAVYPTWGPFFEYRMTQTEFRQAVEAAGFEVVEHGPAGQLDGIYHELNPFGLLVGWKNWKFRPSPIALWLNRRLKGRPYFLPHMQAIVARKPDAGR